ncbi:hypothetical protein D9M68_870970 [compost metagenome]
MLQELAREHHIAHVHTGAQPTGHAGEDDAVHAKTLDQQRGRGGRGHLANARKHGDHVLPMQVTDPELSPRHGLPVLIGHERQHTGEFVVKRGDDGSARWCGAHGRHWTRTRTKALPSQTTLTEQGGAPPGIRWNRLRRATRVAPLGG